MYGFAAVAVAAWLYAHSQNSVHELMSSAHWEILSRNKSHSCRHTDHKYSTNSANDIGVTQRFTFETLKWWEREEKKKSTLHLLLLLLRKPLITLNWNGAICFFARRLYKHIFILSTSENEKESVFTIFGAVAGCTGHISAQAQITKQKTKTISGH